VELYPQNFTLKGLLKNKVSRRRKSSKKHVSPYNTNIYTVEQSLLLLSASESTIMPLVSRHNEAFIIISDTGIIVVLLT